MPRLGITSTVALSIVLLISIVMSITTFVDIRAQRAIYYRQLEERGAVLTQTFDGFVPDLLYHSNVDALDDVADIVTEIEDIEYVQIFRPDGRLLVSTDQSRYPTGRVDPDVLAVVQRGASASVRRGSESVVVASPVRVGPTIVGGFALVFSTATSENLIRQTAVRRIWLALALIAISVPVSFLLAQYFVRPLRRLVSATRKIALGTFEPPELDQRGDEIGELISEFRGMSDSLQKERGELESRVEDRTVELRASEEQARSLTRRLVEVQESERRSLAMELHDEIGQQLTGLRLLVENSRRLGQPQNDETLVQAMALLDDLMEQVRDISLNLRPSMLDDLGLLPAILWLTNRYGAAAGMHVALEHSGLDRRFAPDIETTAYRVVQEALTNVARHANTSEAHVEVRANNGTLRASIRDGGSGFEVSCASFRAESLGLAGLRERVQLVQGSFEVRSDPGIGTELSVELPVAPTAGATSE